MVKLLEINNCAECKYWPYDGYACNAQCELTGEQLTLDVYNDPINTIREFGKNCPLSDVSKDKNV